MLLQSILSDADYELARSIATLIICFSVSYAITYSIGYLIIKKKFK